ncbi:MAG: hypothetical protein KAS90_02535 [Candidatus Aenigmarchaeota archaeon]|nr:hypothetical protein [Candidatus Aenigmarchaeota archaeon]
MYFKSRFCNLDDSDGGTLEKIVRRYSDDFSELPLGRPEIQKYVLVKKEDEENYFLTVSNEMQEIGLDAVQLIFFGPVEKKVEQYIQEFQEAARLKTIDTDATRCANTVIEQKMKGMSSIFSKAL